MPEGEPTSGQVPASQEPQAPTSGQVPQAPQSDPNPNPPAEPQTQQPQEPGNKPQLSLEQALDALEKARKDAAKNRIDAKRLAELEAAQKAADDAKLTETERLQKQYAEAQAEAAQARLEAREKVLRAEIRAAAAATGVNPALALRLIDLSDVEDDDNGDPKNITDLLKKAITDFGITPGASQQPASQAQPATPNPGASNPQRQNGPLTITANQYLDPAFKAEFYKTHGMDILKAVNAGKVTIV